MSLLAIAALLLAPQDTPDKTIRKYLSGRAAELERDFLPSIKTAADFEKARPELRRQYLDMLGLWPLPEKTPLAATVTGNIEGPGYTIEKLHFQSRPGLYVTANLYVPRPAQGRYPAVLYSCGHYNQKRDGNKTACQDHGIWLAAHGYVCLVYDTLQLGEIAAIHHGTYREQRWWWHSRGYTSAGVECWNAIRGLDYLCSRPEVDAERIGATGISGGGAATFWISAADDRVKVSVPVSGMADLGFYVAEDGVNGHCDCMFLYNNYRWNWTTIAALVAPRPMLFTNSDKDGIFPMSANERVINRLEHLYARFGESDRVEAMVSIGGHAYRTDLRRAIFEFLNRHLKGDARRVEDPDAGLGSDGKHRIPYKELRVFPEDSDIPKDQINTKIDETFVPVAKVELPKPESFEVWKKDLIERLKTTCFGAWASPKDTGLTSSLQSGEPARVAVVLGQEDPADRLPAWAQSLAPESSAMILKPRAGWTRKNPPNTVERSLALVGETADSGRVHDILGAVRESKQSVALIGRGQAGILSAYAALYEPSVSRVTLIEPPASHREGPHFLGVLKVLDIPEALGLLAPRPLTIIGGTKEAFDRTAEIYRLAGAADKLERK